MILVLARHGQSVSDIEDRYGGSYDDSLTELGRQQADDLGKKLAVVGVKYHRFYSSPLNRAMETAAIVGAAIGRPPTVFREFRERDTYGILTGLTKTEAADRYPDEVRIAADYSQTVTGAEDYRRFSRRIIGGLHRLIKDGTGTTVLVTHGGPLRFIFRELLQKGEVDIDDCAYVVLKADKDSLKLIKQTGIRYK